MTSFISCLSYSIDCASAFSLISSPSRYYVMSWRMVNSVLCICCSLCALWMNDVLLLCEVLLLRGSLLLLLLLLVVLLLLLLSSVLASSPPCAEVSVCEVILDSFTILSCWRLFELLFYDEVDYSMFSSDVLIAVPLLSWVLLNEFTLFRVFVLYVLPEAYLTLLSLYAAVSLSTTSYRFSSRGISWPRWL